MHVFFGPRVPYPLLILGILSRHAVFGSEGAVRECCEPMSPTPSFSTTEFPQDYFTSTELLQPGMKCTFVLYIFLNQSCTWKFTPPWPNPLIPAIRTLGRYTRTQRWNFPAHNWVCSSYLNFQWTNKFWNCGIKIPLKPEWRVCSYDDQLLCENFL